MRVLPRSSGVNDTVPAWKVPSVLEREHRHPTAALALGILQRRRDAEVKLEQHLQEARRRAPH